MKPTNLIAEMLIGGNWVDITKDVRLGAADSGGGVGIKWGRSNEAASAEPTEVDFVLNNGVSRAPATLGQSAVYSQRNPAGPYWGLLGRNIPVRFGLDRTIDNFTRSVSSGWGSTPTWEDGAGVTQAGYAWTISGTASNFNVGGSTATIQATAGMQMATFGVHGDVDITTRVQVSNRTSEFGIILRLSGVNYYTAYITPTTTDRLRLGKVVPSTSTSIAYGADPPTGNVVAATWYRMRAQQNGRQGRVKIWLDGTTEPSAWTLTIFDNRTPPEGEVGHAGAVGVFAKDGSALVTFDSIQVDHWRAHAEMTKLPTKFDVSRKDHWVPVAARGVLQRYGQGRKALASAITQHLSGYTSLGWLPLEAGLDLADTVGNASPVGRIGSLRNVNYGTPDSTGVKALPGSAGYAELSEDNSYITMPVPAYDNVAPKSTFLMFFQIDEAPTGADTPLFKVFTTGPLTWVCTLQMDGVIRIDGITTSDNVVQISGYGQLWISPVPVGSWVACTLYLKDSSPVGNTTYAWNYYHPAAPNGFFSITGTAAGWYVGRITRVTAMTSASGKAAGPLKVAHMFVYEGDLPFVDLDFASAASAYNLETSVNRFIRLLTTAGIRHSANARSDSTEQRPQVPSKLLDTLDDMAEAAHGIISEDRSDISGLMFTTREALYLPQSMTLDIGAGHLVAPLDPMPDDQGTRNDVTVTQKGTGEFAVSVQTSGPLNIKEPEIDPDGVGVYDEAPELNIGYRRDLQPAANWRRALGTQTDPRYPAINVNLMSEAYQTSEALRQEAMSINVGRVVTIVNPEASPDPSPQMVQSGREDIDLYEHKISWVTTPAAPNVNIGVVGSTTRVGHSGCRTTASFVSGTNTALAVERTDASYGYWVRTVDDPQVTGFDIMVDGVRLTVSSISGTSDPQTITVVQTPVNGVIKTIPAGKAVTLAAPWVVGW